MPIYDRQDVLQQPTVPDDTYQSYQFGTIFETVKDAFLLELRHYFSTDYGKLRSGELPRLEKYSVSGDVVVDPMATAVNIIRSYPDVMQNLPLVAVLAVTGRNTRLSISDHHTSLIIEPATIYGSTTGPFNITPNSTVVLTSKPDGKNDKTSTFTFTSTLFADITAATLDEVVAAINFQAMYVRAFKHKVGADYVLGIRGGGSHGTQFPNKIVIVGGTALSALGLTMSQSDQNYGSSKQAYYRHHIASTVNVAIEIVAESENIRTEVSDLVNDFVTYVLSDRLWTLYGRSAYDPSILNENYQIIIKDNEISWSGETEVARAGDARDKLYINRLSIPCMALLFSDRVATNANGSITVPVVTPDILLDPDLPEMN